MKPAPFEYLRATSVSEALEFLQHDDAKIIAGGQSLVPMMNFRLAQPERLVDINAIAELTEISEDGADIVIGSLVRHAEAMRSPLLARRLPVIAEAMRHVAHLAIRNRGTVGGSLVHADPSAEWPLLVALLNGEIIVEGPEERRYLAAEEFFIAPLVTDIGEDEILTAVRFPEPPSGAGMAFDEVARRAAPEVQVTGHTDRLGSVADNDRLARQRAFAAQLGREAHATTTTLDWAHVVDRVEQVYRSALALGRPSPAPDALLMHPRPG